MKCAGYYAGYRFIVEIDRYGTVASCPALAGCHSQGRTLAEAAQNIRDAIRLHVAYRAAHSPALGTESYLP